MKIKKNIVLSLIAGTLLGHLFGTSQQMKKINEQANKWKRESDKYEQTLLMTIRWLKVKMENGKLEDYFLQKGYHTIAIYGMNYVGVRLYEELEGTSIKVLYGIDKYTSSSEVNIPVYSLEKNLDEVDAVVVTPVYYYEEIRQDLSRKLKSPVISMNDVLFEGRSIIREL